jgi:putative ABC transport system permease protein
MDNLALSNVLHRKTRTIVSAAGVALGVVLVILTVGLVHGFLLEQGRRNSALTAEIMFHAQSSNSVIDLSPTLSLPVSLADELGKIDGVEYAVPVGRYAKGLGGMVDGIDYDSFTKVSDMRAVQGRPPVSGDEAIVDRYYQEHHKLKLGDTIPVFERPFKVVGIYQPESMGRIKVPLSTLQAFTNRPGLCSMILVKVKDPSREDQLAAEIKQRFPENPLFFTRNLPVQYATGIPALQTFLHVVIGLAIVVSSLVILLAMYTTVIERTRQIGVLKSLGASRAWIASEVEKEALLISLIGLLSGLAISVGGKYAIEYLTPLKIELETAWFLYAVGMGALSGTLGALYPALRAANQDPIKALSYE